MKLSSMVLLIIKMWSMVFPNLTNLLVQSTEQPAGIFTSGTLITITNSIFSSSFTTSTNYVCIACSGGTDVVTTNSYFAVLVSPPSNTSYSVNIMQASGQGAAFVLDSSQFDIIINPVSGAPGNGIPTLSCISAQNVGALPDTTVISTSCHYGIGWSFSPLPASAFFQVFSLDDASVVSRNDDVEVIVVPSTMQTNIATLGLNGGSAQQVDVLNMVFNFAYTVPSQVSTMNIGSIANMGSTGYFQNIQFRGLNGYVPSQTPSQTKNTFRQINVLVDDQVGGQDLVGVTIVTDTQIDSAGYNVTEIDSVILWEGMTGATTIVLPSVGQYKGRRLTIRNTGLYNSTVTIQLQPWISDTIDMLNPGVPFLLDANQTHVLISDGSSTWWSI